MDISTRFQVIRKLEIQNGLWADEIGTTYSFNQAMVMGRRAVKGTCLRWHVWDRVRKLWVAHGGG